MSNGKFLFFRLSKLSLYDFEPIPLCKKGSVKLAVARNES